MDNKKTHFCGPCNFSTNNKADFVRHLKTSKHFLKHNTPDNEMDNKKTQKNALPFSCECGKKYKFKSGLCKHRKNCDFLDISDNSDNKKDNKYINNDMDYDDSKYKEMFFKLMEENKEFKDILVKQQTQISELIPKVGNNTYNNTANINQKLNINIFLNEKCKDALNIEDFVKNIEIDMNQLDFTKNKGLTEGLSNAIIESMNKLSLYERPLHCTDVKRETLYIKDNDIWEKDGDKSKIKRAIKELSNKQFKSIKKWTDENPDFKEVDDKKDEFVKLLAAVSKDSSHVDDKVIKNLCNNAYLKDILEK